MYYCVLFGFLLFGACDLGVNSYGLPLIRSNIKDCLMYSKDIFTCFSNKAAETIETLTTSDLELIDGIKFVKNDMDLNTLSRSHSEGSDRFLEAVSNFLDTHTLSVDLTEDNMESRKKETENGSGFGSMGTLGLNTKQLKKGLKKEGKYVQYAFMVLLGIFGLTGPLMMNTLAILASKALIASKMALIIVGSIALKKIFEKDGEQGSVKVHTVNADDDDKHDRIFVPGQHDRIFVPGRELAYRSHAFRVKAMTL